MISQMLREDVVRRIRAGELTVPLMATWEPPVWNLPLDSVEVLPRLRRRVYAEFPDYDEDYLSQILDMVIAENRHALDMRHILRRVKEKAGSGL